jgi:hypothetical protein
MKNATLSILYFAIGIIAIILLDKHSFYPGFLTKASIIPVLMILFFVNLFGSNRLHVYMFVALFFSWAGDITLEFAIKNEFFLLSVSCVS